MDQVDVSVTEDSMLQSQSMVASQIASGALGRNRQDETGKREEEVDNESSAARTNKGPDHFRDFVTLEHHPCCEGRSFVQAVITALQSQIRKLEWKKGERKEKQCSYEF
ncbi:uncharacterized protein MEPE_05695 [Melanopsichium pennsylvanicum]|uniref:Uncharacterized protein n=1 Tax=Melanopsichium pennsylvanicum TaxID=63383 RepID=A0AAJ5C7J8_9BASI|nr:uncharacterized protein MEPE_05695 [Melanopsichium pennsylvanicum]